MPRPVYFLSHPGDEQTFSGYGIPFNLNQGSKSPLIGMLMIDRPGPCPPAYIRELRNTFGEVFIGPMTANHDRGVYARMGIEDPVSLGLLRDDVHREMVGYVRRDLEMALGLGRLPNPRLRVRWSPEERLWISRFDDYEQSEAV